MMLTLMIGLVGMKCNNCAEERYLPKYLTIRSRPMIRV
ncbi:hypothetical protein SAMN04490199_1089 [Pseudomonas marginalis]|nr:hypothetical protein SAMN04490199_1089 [Pseudomonas marginalis]